MSKRDAPTLEQACQRVVVRNLRTAHFQGRAEEKKRATAFFHIFLEGIDGGLLVVRSGTSDDHHCAIGWHFGLLQKANRLGVVFFFYEHVSQARVTAALGIVELVLSASGDKANRSRTALHGADECAGDVFLAGAFRFFFLGVDLDDGGAVALDSGFAGQLGLLIGVNVFNMDLGRKIRVRSS